MQGGCEEGLALKGEGSFLNHLFEEASLFSGSFVILGGWEVLGSSSYG
jgi:hypothetical protein